MTTVCERREWLQSDGLGGFASGAASGLRTRRYHALLLVATTPPTPLLQHLDDAGIDRVSEIADGDSPFCPQGCPFQAWPVGEAVRLVRLLE